MFLWRKNPIPKDWQVKFVAWTSAVTGSRARNCLCILSPETCVSGTFKQSVFLTYVHKKSPRLDTLFPNARSEKRRIPAQNDRAATNPTQNPSTYTVVSFQFNTNFPVYPTLSRSLLQKFPVYRILTARVHINLDTRPLKTSLVTLPPL